MNCNFRRQLESGATRGRAGRLEGAPHQHQTIATDNRAQTLASESSARQSRREMPQHSKSNSLQQQQQQQQQQQPLNRKCLGSNAKAAASGRQLEALVLEQLELPEQVVEFRQFEELSKSYDIEQPFVPRTQIELLFDVYDGRKLCQPFGSMEEEPLERAGEFGAPTSAQEANQAAGGSQANLSTAPPASLRRSSFQSQKRRQSSQQVGQLRSASVQAKQTGAISWCRLLFARRKLNCCLRPSDTQQELGLVSASTSAHSLGRAQLAEANNSNSLSSCSTLAAAQLALRAAPAEQPEVRALKSEALQLLENALASSASRAALLDQWQAGGGALEPAGLNSALALESAQLESSGGAVSVCLLDKRRCQTVRLNQLLHVEGGHFAQLASGAQNGRLWARAGARLVALRRRLRASSSAKVAAASLAQGERTSGQLSKLAGRQIERLARRVSRKFWAELERERAKMLAAGKRTASQKYNNNNNKSLANGHADRKLDNQQLEQVVELVKSSLNQLIDAQLLLRNKLTLGLDQTSSMVTQQVRSAEYETLLRNNFNLLKIWQNLEETKRLVCFVCEPIRASLADVFAFNRQRLDWPPASHFETVHLNSLTLATTNENGSASRQLLLASPLVSLDAIQVKRGLLQILEALNFLHAICKLVHRNVTPRNLLICQNDNWKLSGLEFALRFESTTISESASMMAHEFSQTLGPMLANSLASGQQAGPAGGTSSTSGLLGASNGGAGGGGSHHTGASGQLRRQRTLHQTKCQHFVEANKRAGSRLLLQPDLDYLAPEIVESATCSHKSDLFSFGLILAQTYDLCQHRAPLASKASLQNYQLKLKKLDNKAKLQLVQVVPSELRAPLLEMLDSEPNLRPSANHVLQLLKRPVEMCATSESSLKHLRNSLAYLDGRLQWAATTSGPATPQNLHQEQQQQQPDGAAPAPRSMRPTYFKRVTSAAANRQPAGRQQTHNLQLLNQLVRAIDSMTAPHGHQAGAGSGRLSFGQLRLQFELTLETLKQVLRWSQEALGGELSAGLAEPARCCPADSRSLLLILALHRRLLEQVGAMRAELPPICRLAASASQQQPLDRNLASANHRALADFEERLHLIVSRQSLARLTEALADPLLKLDEFLLVFELVNDLVAFVGQRCRLNYAQRGKQLLQELTPFAGCATLSSSEEEEEDEEEEAAVAAAALALNELDLSGADDDSAAMQQHHQFYPYESQNPAARLARASGQSVALSNSRMMQHQQPANQDNQSYNQHQASRPNSRQQQQQQQHLFQVPTSINITAPSPMGSVRDISRASLASSTGTEGSPTTNGRPAAPFAQHHQQAQPNERQYVRQQHQPLFHQQPLSNIKRHSHQDVTKLVSSTDYLVEQTRQMNLAGSPQQMPRHHKQQQQQQQPRYHQRRSVAVTPTHQSGNASAGNQDSDWAQSEGDEPAGPDERSRSKLIDELLKTINDDSFNEIIDFNNKLSASNKTATSELDLINAQRPKSAIGALNAGAQATGENQASNRYGQQSDLTSRPRTLNLNSSGPSAQAGGNRQRGSVCAPAGQQSSTFDNVIRRMSTNLVQNFTKMSGSTLATADNQTGLDSSSSTNLRRERSNQSTYMNNLIVDTSQVPARRHSDNTINVPRIQVALSSPSSAHSGSRSNLNQRASVSASKLANKWKLSAKSNQREATDKLSPNLGGALGYMRRHSSGNATNGNGSGSGSSKSDQQSQSNGGLGAHLLNASPFKQAKSSSNLGLDFLLSNRSMKRRCSAASMLGHQTQRKAEDLLDAGMKSVQNMFS